VYKYDLSFNLFSKNAISGQPDDIEAQLQMLVLKYIENPHSIILAVSSATDDIVNSESIKLAKMVDPHGKRTLGVLTKLDLLEKYTDADEVLDGKIIKIKLGMIGVVLRSKTDLDENKSVAEAVKDEEKYLNRHFSKYQGRIGTTFLSERLNKLLMKNIAESLPHVYVSD